MRPDLGSIHAAARRARAVEMHRLIVALFAALFRRPAKPAPQVAACLS